jgi:hypothetical protein
MDVVAVDWSGAAQGAATRIWLAHVVDGELVTLRNGRTRQQVVDDLVELRAHCPAGLVVGLDFSFSFPAWFVRARRCTTVDDMWRTATREGEDWLAECAPPFWGRPGRPRPPLDEHLRRAEKAISVGGISPKSVFQIGGAGAVGTGSIRGMPYLRQLRESGFSIWPFDPALAVDRARDLPPAPDRAGPQEQPRAAHLATSTPQNGRSLRPTPHPSSGPRTRSMPGSRRS